MKVTVDPELCISCQLCVEMCSSVFFLEEDVAVAIDDDISGADADCAREAADNCPTDAIAIED